jgi:hypothetical protein
MNSELEAYREAYEKNDVQIVHKHYSRYTETIPAEYDSLYYCAIRHKSIDALKYVIELEKQTGLKTYNEPLISSKQSPLHIAIYYFKEIPKFAEILLEIPDINMHIENKYGFSPIDYAISNSAPDLMIMVLEKMAATNALISKNELCRFRGLFHSCPVINAVYGVPDSRTTEDDVANFRYRVYFCRSLVSKLLLCMES